VVFVPVRSQRGLPVDELEEILRDLGIDEIPVDSAESPGEAVEKATGPILITGSLFLAGQALSEIQSQAEFEVSEQ